MSEQRIKILLVEDHLQVREGLAAVLKLASTNVSLDVVGEARNGGDALAELRALEPDIILMDLEMPGLDGCEITRRIKLEKPAVRVILMSNQAGAEAQVRAHAAGADGFVTKGDSYEIFLKEILCGR